MIKALGPLIRLITANTAISALLPDPHRLPFGGKQLGSHAILSRARRTATSPAKCRAECRTADCRTKLEKRPNYQHVRIKEQDYEL
jgi:hypothetical protein